MNDSILILYIVAGIGLAFVLFLIIRGLILWYFKINLTVSLLRKQIELLKKIAVGVGADISDIEKKEEEEKKKTEARIE